MQITRIALFAAIGLALGPAAALAAGAEKAPAAATTAAKPGVAPAEAIPSDNASQYCRNIANPAADARYARQADSLAAMQKALDERIAALEAKRAEYQDWVTKRESFLARADQAVVAIYSQMRPDAASKQIAVMEEEAAAAILSKLSPRIASAILNEMDAIAAARLTNVMAGLSGTKKAGNT